MAGYSKFISATLLIVSLVFTRAVAAQILPDVDINLNILGTEDTSSPTPTPTPTEPQTQSEEPQQETPRNDDQLNNEPPNNDQESTDQDPSESPNQPQGITFPVDEPFIANTLSEEAEPTPTQTATPSPTLKLTEKAKPIVFSYSDVAKPVATALVILLAALTAVLVNSRNTIFKYLRKYTKPLKKKVKTFQISLRKKLRK